MLEESKKSYGIGLVIFLIIIGIIWIGSLNSKITDLENWMDDLQAENSYLENRISDYESSLEEANSQIEEANSMIEDAQGYAWSSYEDMGYALDNLSTVDTIPEP